jgi:hypothetical protein
MGLFTWINRLLPPNDFDLDRLEIDREIARRRGSNLPSPGSKPVATDGDLLKVWDRIFWADDARRAIYALGRADERTAILRALGVEP